MRDSLSSIAFTAIPWDRKPEMLSEERMVDFGPIGFKDFRLSHRNPMLLITLSFVPGGTTESSPALQCRVPAPPFGASRRDA